MCSSNFYHCICKLYGINPKPSTALNDLTSDTTKAIELFIIVSFITFDKLMSDLLKYAVTLGDIFALYLHCFKCSIKCVVPLVNLRYYVLMLA